MRTTVIYHSNDFDGLFCREIARHFLGDKDVTYIGWNYGDPPVHVPEDGTIYVMDLPVDKVFGAEFKPRMQVVGEAGERFGLAGDGDVAVMVFAALQRVIWIDHHASSIATHPADIPGYRIDGVAACRLAYQWFAFFQNRPNTVGYVLPFKKEDFVERRVTEPLALTLAGEYDVAGPNANEQALDFQFGLRSTEIAGDEEQLLTVGDFGDQLVQEIMERGVAVRAYLDRADRLAVKSGFTLSLDGLTFLAFNAGRANSKVFQDAAQPEHDALLGFCWRGFYWTVSLYAIPGRKANLLEVARRHGGGGHPGACGWTCKKLPFDL